jgi:hypothetical protein
MGLVSDQRSAPPPADPLRTGRMGLADKRISSLILALGEATKSTEGRDALGIVYPLSCISEKTCESVNINVKLVKQIILRNLFR